MLDPTITKVQYTALLEAMRDGQMGYRKAAEAVGVSPKVAWRAYKEGWPSIAWAKPIEKVIKEDKVKARAAARNDALAITTATPNAPQNQIQVTGLRQSVPPPSDNEIAAARNDVIAARREEGLMVKSTRNHALTLLSRTQKLNRAIEPLVNKAILQIERMSTMGVELDLHDTLQLMAKIGVLSDQAIGIAERSIAIERRVLGEPDDMSGGVGGNMSHEEAIATLHGIRDTLHEALEHGNNLIAIEAGEDSEEE